MHSDANGRHGFAIKSRLEPYCGVVLALFKFLRFEGVGVGFFLVFRLVKCRADGFEGFPGHDILSLF